MTRVWGYFAVFVALLATRGCLSIRPSSKRCGGNDVDIDVDVDSFDGGETGRTLLQSGAKTESIRSCSWHIATKSCDMSMAAMATFYDKIEGTLKDFGFSIQDCSLVDKKELCTKKKRIGCNWSESSGKGRCEPLLLSDLDMLVDCYGAGENIFERKCPSLSRSKCRSEANAGCEWDNIADCSFSYPKFVTDMQKRSEGDDEVTITFTDEGAKRIKRLAEQKCPVANNEEDCLAIDGCIYDENTDDCVARPSHVMREATIKRTDPVLAARCDLMDLVLTGECEGGTKDDCDKRKGNICYWDDDLSHCMPSPSTVFERMAKSDKPLLEKFKDAGDRCKRQTDQNSCEELQT